MSRPDVNRLEVDIRHKSFAAASGGKLDVIGGLAFSLGNGEVGALVGPSGCGKTTLLRIIAGLDRDYEGNIALPDHGRLGVVFQEPRLLPWRTLEQNVRLAAPEASNATLPSYSRSSPAMMRNSVVLPQPDGPTSAPTSPLPSDSASPSMT